MTPPAPGKKAPTGAQPFVAGGGAASVGPAGGFTPEDLASAYGYSPTATGAGQTVGIVDAFDDPAIESDLAEFNAQYGLPTCTDANGCFTKVGQTGSRSSLPAADTTGWSVEITLDVETVHATCPNCKILLVEGNSASFSNLAAATNEAVALGATEVSNSYGGDEIFTEASERAAYSHPGVPIVASTGDDGYYGWDTVNEEIRGAEMPEFPASLASTVAVGGTSLHLNLDGTRAAETVWNKNGPGDREGLASELAEGATGGGCSTVFAAQPWQQAVAGFASTGCGTKRLDADVSAVGDPLTGFDIYDTYNCGVECAEADEGWVTIGGTSLSAPFISSLYALAGGGNGVSDPALTLYGHAGDESLRFDVATGGNGFCGGEPLSQCMSEQGGKEPNSLGAGVIDCEGTTACNAAPGFDGPSGIGTPNGLGLFKPALPSAAITAPGAATAGSAAAFSAGSSSDPYPGGSITGGAWSWGDGSSGTGLTATHIYALPGQYTVTLTVSDNYGLSSAAAATTVGVGSASSAGVTSAPVPPPALVPNSDFTALKGKLNAKTGVLTFTTTVANPGTFSWLATFQNGKFGAFASASKCKRSFVRLGRKCRLARIVYAKGRKVVAAPGGVTVTLKPSASALKALKHALRKNKGLPVLIRFSFKSSLGGSAVTRSPSLVVKLKK